MANGLVATSDGHLEFAVLGPLEVRLGARRLELPRVKERTLLGILVLRANQVVSVDHLALGLWEDASESRPPATLRVHVSRLRQTLARLAPAVSPRLVTSGHGYSFELPETSIDASRFETGTADGRALLAKHDAYAAAEVLREALSLWRGPVLADLSISAVVEPEIVRLEEARLAAIEDRAEADLSCGRHRDLAAELEHLVTEAPLRERLWGLRIVSLYRSERQADALRAYDDLRQLLLEELGINPSPALQRLQLAVLEQDPSLDFTTPASVDLHTAPTSPGAPRGGVASEALEVRFPPSLARRSGSPLCGRVADLDRLLGHWTGVVKGDRRLVFVSGEAGIGKTRLAAELALRVHGGGGLVLFGRCDEGMAVPFQPFAEALEQVVQARPEADAFGRRGGDLARLVPDIDRRIPGLEPPLQAELETELYILFDAVAGWLGALSARSAVMLVLDDLHWAERSTLLLLRHLARSAEAMRVLIVATFRDTDLGAGHPLVDVVAELRREPSCERLALSGLDPAAIAEMLESTVDRRLVDGHTGFAEWLTSQTSGNPFFLEEIVRMLAARGLDAPLPESPETLQIPEGVRAAIAAKLRRVGPDANKVLALASVMGGTVDFDVLVAVSDLAEDAVLDALDESTAGALLRETTAGGYEFTHALVRSTLYEGLGVARRRTRHRQVAEALIARASKDAAAIAFHLAKAGESGERFVEYAASAGESALGQLAFDQAVVFLSQAVQAATTSNAVERRRCELMVRLGRAERLASVPSYRETLLEAASLATSLGDADLLAEAALTNSRGFESATGMVDSERVRHLEAALASVGPQPSAIRARLLSVLALELIWEPPDSRRLSVVDESVAMARQVGDDECLLQVLIAASVAGSAPDRVPTLAAEFPELLVLAERVGDPQQVAFVCGVGSSHFTEMGDLAEADRLTALVDLHARELDTPFWHWMVANRHSCQISVSGTGDELETAAVHALNLGEAARQPDLLTWFGPVLFGARWGQGRLAEVAGLASQAADETPALAGWRAASALALAAAGDQQQAAAIVGELMADPESCFARNLAWLLSHSVLAEAVACVGSRQHAAREYQLLAPYAGRIPSILSVARPGVNLWLALLAAHAGRPDRAERHFGAAHEQHLRIAAPLWLARTQFEWGRFLLGQGSAERARGLLAEARDGARQTGSADVAAAATELLEGT